MLVDKNTKEPLPETLDSQRMPAHVAIIMDGNGRWARSRMQPRVFGHRKGADRVHEIVEASGRWGIQELTLFAFSEENWQRPPAEVEAIMQLLKFYIEKEKQNLNKNNVCLKAIGNLEKLPPTNRRLLEEAIDELSGNDGLTLTIALSYSSRNEIARASQHLARDVAAGKLKAEQIDEQLFGEYLETRSLREPDLLIRTSGELRISNFLLWQAAYSELYFTDVHWPDFGREEYVQALASYQARERRFGKVEAASLVTNAPSPAASESLC